MPAKTTDIDHSTALAAPSEVVLHEWEQITTPLAAEDWRYLAGLNERLGEVLLLTPASAPGQVRLKAGHYVGRIRLPSGCQIEIRPKVRVDVIGVLMARAGLFGSFLPPLIIAAHAPADSLPTWLARVAEALLAEVESILLGGLRIAFTTHEDDSIHLRGKLNMREALYSLPASPQRSEIPDITVDGVENRVLRLACEQVAQQGLAEARRVGSVLRRLSAVSLDRDALHGLSRLTFTRLNERYRTALALAEVLLRCETITGGSGAAEFPGYVINMDHLFERVVINSLAAATAAGWQVSVQHPAVLDLAGAIEVRPDAVLTIDGEKRIVVDAKYKPAPTNADLYQALAYCHALRATRAVLVYPDLLPTQTHRIASPAMPLTDHNATHKAPQIVIVVLGLDLAGSATIIETSTQHLIMKLHTIASSFE
jgi:5-methylcytosine-specific restriction enzyme subunit McrC